MFKAEYDIYVASLNTAVQEACDVQKLQRNWLLKKYVGAIAQFVAKESDKFEIDKDLETMTTEHQRNNGSRMSQNCNLGLCLCCRFCETFHD